MSLAGEASSSQAPAVLSAPPSSPQADRASVARQAPPETMGKQKVKWSWASYAGGSFGVRVRLFSWDGNDTTRVKGDDNEGPWHRRPEGCATSHASTAATIARTHPAAHSVQSSVMEEPE